MNDFAKVIAGKKVYIYGCGKNFNEMLQNYPSLFTNVVIGGIIDACKCENNITINDEDYTIISPEQFHCSTEEKNVILLITIRYCEEIYKNIIHFLNIVMLSVICMSG